MPRLLVVLACSVLVLGGLTGCRPEPTCPAGRQQAAAFPLRASADGRYLQDAAGRPFLLQGDAAWSLVAQLNLQEVEEYLDARRAQGFNAVVVNLIEHQSADDPPRDADGVAPFTTPGDFTTPDERYFAHVDDVLRTARDKGFLVLLAPAYLGWEGGDAGWYQEMVAAGPRAMRRYGEYLGRRYRDQRNVVWLAGGDWTPGATGLALVQALVDGLHSQNPAATVSAHWGPATGGSQLPLRGLQLDTTYTYAPVHLRSLADHDRVAGLPRILVESAYEQDIKHTTTPWLRGQAYGALLTGATGQVFGQGDVWRFDGLWRAALQTPGSCSMGVLGEVMNPLPWQDLRPDTAGTLLLEGAGNRGTRRFAVAASTPDGGTDVVYVPTPRTLRLDLRRHPGSPVAEAVDPTDGSRRPVPLHATGTAGVVDVRLPRTNAAGEPDWVLVVRDG